MGKAVKRMLLALGGIVFFSLLPLLPALIASTIASAHGCQLDEGGTHPCIVMGSDWGGTLYTMFVMAWLGIVTMQIGALAFLIWLGTALYLIARYLWRRGSSPEAGA